MCLLKIDESNIVRGFVTTPCIEGRQHTTTTKTSIYTNMYLYEHNNLSSLLRLTEEFINNFNRIFSFSWCYIISTFSLFFISVHEMWNWVVYIMSEEILWIHLTNFFYFNIIHLMHIKKLNLFKKEEIQQLVILSHEDVSLFFLFYWVPHS